MAAEIGLSMALIFIHYNKHYKNKFILVKMKYN